jgi:zona occludens toxin
MLTPGVEDDDGNLGPAREGCGIWNWYEWFKPGDVIFIDEVQRWFRPRGMGTKPPPPIKHLETHRHLGVDFVFVTQSPMLLDQNIRRLVYEHKHIRRLFGMARAAVYKWDSCCADPSRVKSATYSIWNYPKSAYDLYVSSELHTKPKVKLPAWLAVPVLAVVGAIAVAPTAFGVLSGAATGKGVSSAKNETPPAYSPPSTPPPPTYSSALPQAPLVYSGTPAGGTPTYSVSPAEALSGCIARGSRCSCYTDKGRKVDADASMCADLAQTRPLPPELLPDTPQVRLPDPDDLAALAFLQSNRPGRAYHVSDAR